MYKPGESDYIVFAYGVGIDWRYLFNKKNIERRRIGLLMRNTFGSVGVAVGLIAIAVALIQFWGGPFDPKPPSTGDKLNSKMERLKDNVVSTFKGEKADPPRVQNSFSIDKTLIYGSMSIAFLAVVLGIVAFLRREDKRFTQASIVIGLSGLAFHFLLVALGVFIILAIVYMVLWNFS